MNTFLLVVSFIVLGAAAIWRDIDRHQRISPVYNVGITMIVLGSIYVVVQLQNDLPMNSWTFVALFGAIAGEWLTDFRDRTVYKRAPSSNRRFARLCIWGTVTALSFGYITYCLDPELLDFDYHCRAVANWFQTAAKAAAITPVAQPAAHAVVATRPQYPSGKTKQTTHHQRKAVRHSAKHAAANKSHSTAKAPADR